MTGRLLGIFAADSASADSLALDHTLGKTPQEAYDRLLAKYGKQIIGL